MKDFSTEKSKSKSEQSHPKKQFVPKQEIKETDSPKTNHRKKRADKPIKQNGKDNKPLSKEVRVLDGEIIFFIQ